MKTRKRASRIFALCFAAALTARYSAASDSEILLHTFKGADGAYPFAGLTADTSGNLYGTTYGSAPGGCGGDYGCGTVFKLAPGSHGGYTLTTIHRFDGADGRGPTAKLILDSAGNLYGTTVYGGASQICESQDCGVVFELTPGTGGKWTEKVLHTFAGTDGQQPWSGLALDSSGNLYGTTEWGGAHGVGTVFELSPEANGAWKEKVLHSFQRNGTDGAYPRAGLTLDAAGNLYGTTYGGGVLYHGCGFWGCGTAFELSPGAGGTWSETMVTPLYVGYTPIGGLIFDKSGNLYGTAENPTCTVFELSPGGDGAWTQTAIWGPSDTYGPPSGDLIFDANGNLYGSTDQIVFELQPGDPQWNLTALYTFPYESLEGSSPNGGLILGSQGDVYGTTMYGGTGGNCSGGGESGCGVVFELTP
jgi:uncharacterized repeat protein (TIGR03803 family)